MYTTIRGGFDRDDARLHYAQMQEISKQRVELGAALKEAFEEGHWDRVDRIQLSIDDTEDKLK